MVVVNNPNLIYTVYPRNFREREILNSFFINQLRKDHKVNKQHLDNAYLLDNKICVRISTESDNEIKTRCGKDTFIASNDLDVGSERKLPLWTFGFLY